MKDLSKNLSYKEATQSYTATKLGIDNTPNDEQLQNMQDLVDNIFQPLRDWYKEPIRVNSFFRCKELNKAVGGATSSQHCYGEAIDLDTAQDNAYLFKYIKENLPFDKLIWEFGSNEDPAWVHVSYRKEGNRGEIYKAVKVNGKTKYLKLNG